MAWNDRPAPWGHPGRPDGLGADRAGLGRHRAGTDRRHVDLPHQHRGARAAAHRRGAGRAVQGGHRRAFHRGGGDLARVARAPRLAGRRVPAGGRQQDVPRADADEGPEPDPEWCAAACPADPSRGDQGRPAHLASGRAGSSRQQHGPQPIRLRDAGGGRPTRHPGQWQRRVVGQLPRRPVAGGRPQPILQCRPQLRVAACPLPAPLARLSPAARQGARRGRRRGCLRAGHRRHPRRPAVGRGAAHRRSRTRPDPIRAGLLLRQHPAAEGQAGRRVPAAGDRQGDDADSGAPGVAGQRLRLVLHHLPAVPDAAGRQRRPHPAQPPYSCRSGSPVGPPTGPCTTTSSARARRRPTGSGRSTAGW